MANIMDYLDWRGDLSFKQAKFNDIDNLILSRLSYFDFDDVLKNISDKNALNENISKNALGKNMAKEKEAPNTLKKEDSTDKEKETSEALKNKANSNDEENVIDLPIKLSLKEAYKKYAKKKNNKLLDDRDKDLFEKLANSKRFKDLILKNYINKIDEEISKQFSAIIIEFPKEIYSQKTYYVSYRGTDNTLIGWKEDLYMSFSDVVPSQIDAVEYLNENGEDAEKLIVGGHSKGGNLAIYAGIFANSKIKKKIAKIYSNDGPGVQEKIAQKQEYKEMIDKVKTFVPQSSVIGRLLVHEEKYQVVESTQKGIMQHDLYSWQVLGIKFVTLESLTDGSKIIDKSIKLWLEELSVERRKYVIDMVFDVVNTSNANTLKELRDNWLENSKVILKAYKEIPQEDRKIITETVKKLTTILLNNAWDKKVVNRNKIKLSNNSKEITKDTEKSGK